MKNCLFYPFGTSSACHFAAESLRACGIPIIDHPSPDITHLLLDVPTAISPETLSVLLQTLPTNITVVGGRIPKEICSSTSVLDLLDDEAYLVKNAAVTAECTLQVLMQQINFTIRGSRILLLGWGRISKILSFYLQQLFADVSVYSRSYQHRAEAEALGLQAISFPRLTDFVSRADVLINTAPSVIIPESMYRGSHAVKIDLASIHGLEGPDVVFANGLPGKLAPLSSGKLIAQTILKKLEESK